MNWAWFFVLPNSILAVSMHERLIYNIPLRWCPIRIAVIEQNCVHTQHTIREKLDNLCCFGQRFVSIAQTIIAWSDSFNDSRRSLLSNFAGTVSQPCQVWYAKHTAFMLSKKYGLFFLVHFSFVFRTIRIHAVNLYFHYTPTYTPVNSSSCRR